MIGEVLPFLSGTLHTIIVEIAQKNDPIAKEIIRVDDLVNQMINVQQFLPEKLRVAIKEKVIDSSITDEVSMLTIRMDGTFEISFLPKGKDPEYSRDGVWSRKNRQNGKIGKVFQKALVREFKQAEWENFVNLIKAEICQCNDFELVSGEQIRYWYNEANYYECKSSLGNSCMRYDSAQSYFDIYVENAKMLITKKNGKLTGRAIVWEINENTTILDRIYVCFDYLVDCFIDYAKEHKWIIRDDNSLLNTGDEQLWLTSEDNYECPKKIDLSIELKHVYEEYPYVDSFRYLSSDKRVLTTYTNEYSLDSTEGYVNGCGIACDDCGRMFYGYNEDDMPDELHWSDWGERYLCDDCCYFSSYLEDYIPNSVQYYTVHNYYGCTEYIPRTCIRDYLSTGPDNGGDIVEIDGEFYDINYKGVFYNEDTERYEIRSDSN